ncbi:phospholipase [Cronobacter muytjensii]|uniref:phospholipase n=1 Tax=Cronobacter muytjensii TaxID=413501 RepID=UPI002A17D865|nr:phospholipase [Cronobacter muytjensii]ELY6276240.1 phospholipase [Cronobacter muytjensii]MEB8642076.1 phospholipase [Cronobacter muytjensii]
MYHIKIVSIFRENVPPARFERIMRPDIAAQWINSVPDNTVRSLFSRYDQFQPRNGANPYQTGRDLRKLIAQEFWYGNLVAIDESSRPWSSTTELYYINQKGELTPTHAPRSLSFPLGYIIVRYGEMVRAYGTLPPPTVRPAQVVKSKAAAGPELATPGKDMKQTAAQLKAMTKAERWQARKDLISKGNASIYPDAQIAAKRLADNNIAVEKAKLAENVYKTVNPLETTPGVPEGWKDISNDADALNKLGLKSKMLYDDPASPNFLARVYEPDQAVFGKDMNPTVVFRGSREPEFASVGDNLSSLWNKGELAPVKNGADWSNNFAQGVGKNSTYYQSAVGIGDTLAKSGQNVDIAGHSLGGGLASATAMASGKPAWTFNAAGLNSGTVEKYGGTVLGKTDDIQAYRVEGELLTKVQEVNVWEDLKTMKGLPGPTLLKEGVSALSPNAAGIPHDLPGGTGSALERHGIGQAINCIEQQKDEDIAIIGGRL